MSRRIFVLPALVAATGIAAACRAPARTVPTPAVARTGASGDYCWWTVYRSPLPVDTVVARFARAYEAVGLAGAGSARVADTAWAQGTPTVLGGAHAGGTYAARVVAYRRGDSTHFRQYVSLVAPPGGWPASDSAHGGDAGFGRQVGFCTELSRAAKTQGTAPREPDGEEKLDVWRRRP